MGETAVPAGHTATHGLEALDLDYRPRLPRDLGRGIAIVGAGGIVRAAHLPAYRMAGFRVVGLHDLDRGRAAELAADFGVPRVFATLDELLADPDVLVVDIAVPAAAQPAVACRVAAAGKHLLCQKPLAESYAAAERIVSVCAAAGVRAAVNQQMRWAPGIRASHAIIRRGWLGQPLQGTIAVNVRTDWEQWPWLVQSERLEVMYHSIHYLDALRWLLGTPTYVYADGARFPGQAARGESRTVIHMRFPGETRALVQDNHNHIAGPDDWYATFRFEGTEGIVEGTNGLLYNYPAGREDTLRLYSRRLRDDCWFTPRLEGRWFPHAFMGTMGELLCAVEEGREPENSVRDNLLTVRLLLACYRSMAENRPVRLEEIG